MTTRIGLVHSGDSIAGSNSPASYFHQAYGWTPIGDNTSAAFQAPATYYSGNIIARNMAVAATRLNTNGGDDLVPMALVYIDPIIPMGYVGATIRKYIFTCAIGSNDGALGGYATTALYAAAVASCCGLRRTAGYNSLGMCTLLPRKDGTMSEVNRLSYNATLTGGGWAAGHGIDFIINLDSEATMGNPASCDNATYYEQVTKVHPTAAGHLLLAPIYLAAVNAAIAAL